MAVAVAGIVIGVMMAGAGIVGRVDPQAVKSTRHGIVIIPGYNGFAVLGMESNISFLAPAPLYVEYYVLPFPTLTYKHGLLLRIPIVCTD